MDVAIICEGKNDKEFFEKLFQHLKDTKIISDFNLKQLKFYIFGGKSKVFDITHKKYAELKLEIERTKKILDLMRQIKVKIANYKTIPKTR